MGSVYNSVRVHPSPGVGKTAHGDGCGSSPLSNTFASHALTMYYKEFRSPRHSCTPNKGDNDFPAQHEDLWRKGNGRDGLQIVMVTVRTTLGPCPSLTVVLRIDDDKMYIAMLHCSCIHLIVVAFDIHKCLQVFALGGVFLACDRLSYRLLYDSHCILLY